MARSDKDGRSGRAEFTMKDVWDFEEELARRHNASPELREKIKRKIKELEEEVSTGRLRTDLPRPGLFTKKI
jgi:hypothetical protein